MRLSKGRRAVPTSYGESNTGALSLALPENEGVMLKKQFG